MRITHIQEVQRLQWGGLHDMKVMVHTNWQLQPPRRQLSLGKLIIFNKFFFLQTAQSVKTANRRFPLLDINVHSRGNHWIMTVVLSSPFHPSMPSLHPFWNDCQNLHQHLHSRQMTGQLGLHHQHQPGKSQHPHWLWMQTDLEDVGHHQELMEPVELEVQLLVPIQSGTL